MMQHVSPAPALTMMAAQSVPPPPYQESQQASDSAWLVKVSQKVSGARPAKVDAACHVSDEDKMRTIPNLMTATAQQTTKSQPVHITAPPAAANTPVPPSAPLDPQAQLEADKRAVYRHPLFPLLTLLFEKCEQATQGSECITSASFDVDIENFVHQQEQEHKPFFSEDPELDNLMVKAIQVLRIHLLELEKVNELCKDFCNRYITCLKTKMHSDNLLRNDLGGPYSPNQPSISLHSQDLLQHSPNSMTSVSSNPQGIVVPSSALQQGNLSMTTLNSSPVVSGGALYQPVTMVTSQGQVVTQAMPHGSIQIQNTQHPYPTEDEKRQIAGQTNLTLLQVNNWFINARRRILQPMLDASNPDPAPKAKKIKSQHRPTQRFWPNSLASGVLQQQGLPGSNPDGSINMDNLHSLSSDSATMAMQQAMLAAHDDSLDGTEEDEDEDEDMEEDEMEDDSEELQTTNVSDLGLEHNDSLE
ncbi:homeobox protein PKNOX2 isoform X2 [Ambystoma mexicanum]|uniref:homeobox protein PKNOX2 isoform X2 n=1 Tax=Ambystoma mexicanum TaxID=8296 RepID=UPI0037E740A7